MFIFSTLLFSRGYRTLTRILPQKHSLLRVIFCLFLVLSLQTPLKAQEEGPLQAFAGGIARLLEGITSVNIESATLGIDKGIIAGAVIGIGRAVERNPFPTGEHDRFLVKDRMRLGYELGASLVVGGLVSYVQEWTLVYPVPTSLEGTLSRKFLVDLFLPLTVKRLEESRLPQEYALIRESYFEGRGRLKLGGIPPLVIGGAGSIGKIKLSSLISKREKDGRLYLAREKSRFTRYALELWANLVFFDLPIFDTSKEVGTLQREYFAVEHKELNKAVKPKILHSLFSGKDQGTLDNFLANKEKTRQLNGQFKEFYAGLSFIGLFNKETFEREDLLTDKTFYKDPITGEILSDSTPWWQFENRHSHDWTTGLVSEEYQSKVFLSGIPETDQRGKVISLKDPLLKIALEVRDWETSREEYRDVYLPLITRLGHPLLSRPQQSFYPTEKGGKPEGLLKVELHYDEEALDKLINSTPGDWYRELERITGKGRHHWERASESGFHSRDRRRLRQVRLPFHEIQLAKGVKTILRFVKKAGETYDPLLAKRYLLWGIRKTFNVGASAWDVRLLRAFNNIAGTNRWVGVDYKFYRQEGDGNRVIHFTDQGGQPLWKERPKHQMLLHDPGEIYHFFNEDLRF